jgi:predicted AAA+ superfamily ATPase
MEKYVIRANEQFLFKSFDGPYISALLGPRRVGKTTLLEYYMKLHPEKKWVHLNMDVMSQRHRIAAEELALMIEQTALQKIGGPHKLWVFIDEAQKCPALFDQVKILYDTHKGSNCIKFLLTGSAHLNLHKLTAESLAGRVDLLHLREFNLRETTHLLVKDISLPAHTVFNTIFQTQDMQALQDTVAQHRPFQLVLQESLHSHLTWGGLPEVIATPAESDRLKYLSNYLQTYLEKDIRAIDSIGDLHMYQNLMQICAQLTGSVRDDQKIIDALHCSRGTLLKYRDYLLATLQYTEIFPFIRSSVKRLVKSPKGYIINNGLISYLTGLHDLAILKITGLIGHRFENWFLNEIQTWLDTQAENQQIYFWRTAGGAEVDFVITLGKHVVPFEITYATHIESKKLNNLKGFMASCPEASIGVFCYMGEFLYDAEHRILFLPAWMI